MKHQPKPQHGGSREGAGRKPAYGESTKTIRVPHSQVAVVVEYLEGLKSGSELSEPSSLRPISIEFSRSARTVARLGRRVRAGKPTFGDDYQEESVDLGSHFVRDPNTTFVIRVSGWSMRDAGIADGDDLIVDRSVTGEAGRIVIAEIDGELTVKRLQRASKGWRLQAANPEYPDLNVSDKSELHIWGVVTYVIHRL